MPSSICLPHLIHGWEYGYCLLCCASTSNRQRRVYWLSLLCCFLFWSVTNLPPTSSNLSVCPRPTHYPAIQDLVQVVYEYRGGQYGFVSGHSANYFSLAMFTSLLFRNRSYSFFMFLVAVLIAYSRIYIGVHFITDVIPGAIIGMLIGSLVYYFYKKVRLRWVEGARSTPAHKGLAPMCRRWLALLTVFLVFLLSVSFTVMKATARLMS